MLETKRILFNRKFMGAVFLLLLICFSYFYVKVKNQKEMRENGHYIVEYDDEDRQNNSYGEDCENVIKRAELLLDSAKTEADKIKLTKTKNDFEALSLIEVYECEDEKLSNVTGEQFVSVTLVLICLLLVGAFYEERKKGLWMLVHSSERGRIKLYAIRLFILTVFLMLITLLTYGVLFYINWKILGKPDFSQSIQSYAQYRQLNLRYDVKTFLIYFIGFRTISLLGTVLLIWAFITVIGNIGIGFFYAAVVWSIEYFLYYGIETYSFFSAFKKINLYLLMDINEILGDYTVYVIGNSALEKRQIFWVVLFIIIIISALVCIIVNGNTKPYKYNGIYETLTETKTFAKIMNLYPFCLMEFRKMLIWSGEIFVLAVVVVWSFKSNVKAADPYKTHRTRLMGYYEYCEGKSPSEIQEFIENLNLEIQELEQGSYEAYVMSRDISSLQQRLDYINAKTIADEEIQMFDDTSYTMYFSKSAERKRLVCMGIGLVSVIIIGSNLFYIERKSNIESLINSTKSGKMILYRDKFIFMFLISLIIYAVVFLWPVYLHWYDYGFIHSDLDIHNAMVLANVHVKCSLRTYIMVWELLKYFSLLTVGLITGFLSKKLNPVRNIVIGVSVSMVILMALGSIL